ncbi:unnamed protein product [Nesidiocoris tenuis]|uniref:Uncharacterized protein n=1 Tax=Nesidiocoris tenuis TaxID=355587 RepID=A0A6H5GTV9_9HEMI|nr:unnamed protein product [Nesidiocoris tenuis]
MRSPGNSSRGVGSGRSSGPTPIVWTSPEHPQSGQQSSGQGQAISMVPLTHPMRGKLVFEGGRARPGQLRSQPIKDTIPGACAASALHGPKGRLRDSAVASAGPECRPTIRLENKIQLGLRHSWIAEDSKHPGTFCYRTLKGPLPRNRSHGKKCICRKSSQLLDRRLAVSRLRPPGPAVQFLLNLLERLSFGFNNDSHDEYGADERRPREYEIVQVHAPSESDRVVNLVHDERRRRQDERRHSGCEAFDALREIFALNCRSYGSEPQAEENAVNDKTGEWDPVAIRDVDCRLGVEVEPEACAGHCQGATWSNKNRILKMSSCISTKAQPETEG